MPAMHVESRENKQFECIEIVCRIGDAQVFAADKYKDYAVVHWAPDPCLTKDECVGHLARFYHEIRAIDAPKTQESEFKPTLRLLHGARGLECHELPLEQLLSGQVQTHPAYQTLHQLRIDIPQAVFGFEQELMKAAWAPGEGTFDVLSDLQLGEHVTRLLVRTGTIKGPYEELVREIAKVYSF